MKNNAKKLTLSPDTQFLGVCGGLANFYKVDPFYIRLFFCFSAVFLSFGLPLYLIFYVCMPNHEG